MTPAILFSADRLPSEGDRVVCAYHPSLAEHGADRLWLAVEVAHEDLPEIAAIRIEREDGTVVEVQVTQQAPPRTMPPPAPEPAPEPEPPRPVARGRRPSETRERLREMVAQDPDLACDDYYRALQAEGVPVPRRPAFHTMLSKVRRRLERAAGVGRNP